MYLDIRITVSNGLFSTTVYDKRESSNFHIVNYPFMSSNIPCGLSYGIYVSQLVRIGRICNNYDEFVGHNRLITTKLKCCIIRHEVLHISSPFP